MGDKDKSLMDQAKDALGMGDDDKHEHDEHEHDEHGTRRTTGTDTQRDQGWGSDTTARTTDAGGATGTTGARTGTGTREAGSDESLLRDEDTTETDRRGTGV